MNIPTLTREGCTHRRDAALEHGALPDERHARGCAECAREREAMSEITALVRALDPPAPEQDRMDLIHGALLALPDPRAQKRRVSPVWWGAASAAAAVIVGLAVWGRAARPVDTEAAPPLRAHVESATSTRFVHRAATADAPEQVSLRDGRLHIEVEALTPSERFVVATDDAVVDVRATRIEVVATGGELARVRVIAGTAEVRWRDAAPVRVGEGQTWTAPEPTPEPVEVTPAPTGPAVEAAPTPSPAAEDRPRARRTPPSERAFRDGWAAFARADMARAAELFAEVERLAPESALAEDALYGRCVALERADRRAEAVAELRRYLARYPSGARADEVALALAAFEAEAGLRDDARRLYTRALSSPVDTIRARARAGLDRLRE